MRDYSTVLEMSNKVRDAHKHTKEIYKITRIKLGDTVTTAYGDFKLLECWYDVPGNKPIAKWMWTIYNEFGGVHGEHIVVLTFSEMCDYMTATDGYIHKLKYSPEIEEWEKGFFNNISTFERWANVRLKNTQ